MKPATTRIAAMMALAMCFAFPARATSFEDFGKMNTDDEAGLIAFLVQASAHLLQAQGQPDQADRIIALFHDSSNSGGVHQLALNLRMLYGTNKRNETRANNSTRPYQVEDALALTLKDAGIEVPAGFLMKASDDFHPSGLPRQHIYGP